MRLEACSAAARRLFETHPAARLARRPRPESWSGAECLAHLSLTAAAMLPRLETAIGGLRDHGRRSAAPSRMDWPGRVIAWALEPRWLRTRTRQRFVPNAAAPADAVLAEFLAYQARTAAALRSAEGLDTQAARIASPFDEKVRYNVLSAFRILETHERRHLRQAEAAVAATGS